MHSRSVFKEIFIFLELSQYKNPCKRVPFLNLKHFKFVSDSATAAPTEGKHERKFFKMIADTYDRNTRTLNNNNQIFIFSNANPMILLI